jgi:hypothetical protein
LLRRTNNALQTLKHLTFFRVLTAFDQCASGATNVVDDAHMTTLPKQQDLTKSERGKKPDLQPCNRHQ